MHQYLRKLDPFLNHPAVIWSAWFLGLGIASFYLRYVSGYQLSWVLDGYSRTSYLICYSLQALLLYFSFFLFPTWLLWVILLLKGFFYGICSIAIYCSYGQAGPLMHFILLFSDVGLLAVTCFLHRSKAFIGGPKRAAVSFLISACLLCVIQTAFLIPLYMRITHLL